MLQCEIRKDQDVASGHGLRLTKDVPVWRNPPEVARKALLELAVIEAWRRRREDRVARPELKYQVLTPDGAVRTQPKPVTPHEEGQLQNR